MLRLLFQTNARTNTFAELLGLGGNTSDFPSGRGIWCSEAIASARKIEWHGGHRAGNKGQQDKCERGKTSGATAVDCVLRLMTVRRCLIGRTSFNLSQRAIVTRNCNKSIPDIAIGRNVRQFEIFDCSIFVCASSRPSKKNISCFWSRITLSSIRRASHFPFAKMLKINHGEPSA